jgi:cellulose synthase/poly-beta-1,6-N-acetylglucosamine synthase-like glycosyltransferase
MTTTTLYGVDQADTPARVVLSHRQRGIGVGILVGLLVAALLAPRALAIVFVALSTASFLAITVFKARLVRQSYLLHRAGRLAESASALPDYRLPTYTVLVPLYREANVVAPLVSHLSRLDYPSYKLEVLLLCEHDDDITLDAVAQLQLPPFMRVLLVPAGVPRTKPRACNVGLREARGDLLVIFDAEDRPELDQLRKAAALFEVSPHDVACLQARLDYHNHAHNWLTRFFAVEYNHWFDLLLPALSRSNLPIPLGGTSNHFRAPVLRQLSGWDPYNVTEDADLGLRLFTSGYRTRLLDSVTLEEACSEPRHWIPQRTRWVKGYLQTWAVHVRTPELRKRGGAKSVAALHLLIGGTPVANMLNPLFLLLFVYFFITKAHWVLALFPGVVLYSAVLVFIVGNLLFAYVNLIAVVHRERWHLVHAALLSPLYWLMMGWASYRAAWQLIGQPHRWEKTPHGLSGASTDPALTFSGRPT